MSANRFRAPKNPQQSKIARGGMTEDKTRKWLALREAARSNPSLVVMGDDPPLYTPSARRSLRGLRNRPRRQQAAIRKELRRKQAAEEGRS